MQHPRLGMCSPPDSIPILQMLARLTDARLVIEVGVFTGYATLGMALALPPGGRLIACDVSREYTSIGVHLSASLPQSDMNLQRCWLIGMQVRASCSPCRTATLGSCGRCRQD